MSDEFEVKILEFYPVERDDSKKSCKGGLSVNLSIAGVEINLRGILVCKEKGTRWYFNVPFKSGLHHQTKVSVKYPIFSFKNNKLQEKLINEIRVKGQAFVEEWLKTHPEIPLETQPLKKEIVKLQKIEETLSKPTSVIPTRVFVDPPKRKLPPVRKSYAK
jgi:hypothetical protein